MASITDVLRIELASLQAEIARLQKQAEGVSLTISYLEDKDNNTRPHTATSNVVAPSTPVSTAPQKKRVRREPQGEPPPLVQHIIDAMRVEGKPVHYRDIYDVLQRRGVEVKGKDPIRNLSAHMCLHKRFFKSKGNGYWMLAELDNDEENSRNAAGSLAI